MLQMSIEGVAQYSDSFEPAVVVLRGVEVDRRLCLGVCGHHARAAAELVRSRGSTTAPSCRASRESRPARVVGARLSWQDDGPLGPHVDFKLVFERDGATVEEPSCLFGMLKSVLRFGVEIRVDERILEELRPSDGDPRWLAGPLESEPEAQLEGPVREFIAGLEALDRL